MSNVKPNVQVVQANDSQVSLWRGAIALAWLDQTIDDNERTKLNEFIDNYLYFSVEQRDLLKQDISTKIKIDDVWGQITDKQDRAHLINIAMVIFMQDGELDKEENETYKRIYNDHLSALDAKHVMEDIHMIAENDRKDWLEEEQEQLKNLSSAGRIIYYLENRIF